MRSMQGKFALREWKINVSEFVAGRFKKSLFDEDIVVLPADSLHLLVHGRGLSQHIPEFSNFSNLLKAMRRREAEQDTSVIQLVSVFIVRHQARILTYKRTKRLPEERLHNYYSLGFGGHLNPNDISPLSLLQKYFTLRFIMDQILSFI
jgi:predicted NUDIX family phosphoesterase